MFLDTIVFFGSNLRQYLIGLAIIIVSFALGKLVYFILTKIVKVFTAKTKTHLDDLIIDLIDKPIVFLIGLWGLRIGVEQLTLPARATQFIDNVVLVLFILNIAWVVINFIDALILNYFKYASNNGKGDQDTAMARAVGRIFKIVAWIIVVMMLITNLGYDVSALLTGVGLGGLAFALAAQDLLSNLFGGFAIITDKPFRLGDRVRWGTNDGFVRDIGFRTTRIETLDGTMLVVANAELAKITIENVSKEPARRVVAKIGLVYDTPTKKMKRAEDILKDIVLKHKDLKDDSYVGFSDFGDFALIITLVYFIKDPSKTLAVKSAVNMEIKSKFEKEGLEFAYPTQTLILQNAQKKRK